MAYDNNNRGVLFRVFEKANDKAPDFTGKLEVGGIAFELAAWEATSKKGTPYLSLKLQPVAGRPQAGQRNHDLDAAFPPRS